MSSSTNRPVKRSRPAQIPVDSSIEGQGSAPPDPKASSQESRTQRIPKPFLLKTSTNPDQFAPDSGLSIADVGISTSPLVYTQVPAGTYTPIASAGAKRKRVTSGGTSSPPRSVSEAGEETELEIEPRKDTEMAGILAMSSLASTVFASTREGASEYTGPKDVTRKVEDPYIRAEMQGLNISGTIFIRFLASFFPKLDPGDDEHRRSFVKNARKISNKLAASKENSIFSQMYNDFCNISAQSDEEHLYKLVQDIFNHVFAIMNLPLDYCTTFNGPLKNNHPQHYDPNRKPDGVIVPYDLDSKATRGLRTHKNIDWNDVIIPFEFKKPDKPKSVSNAVSTRKSQSKRSSKSESASTLSGASRTQSLILSAREGLDEPAHPKSGIMSSEKQKRKGKEVSLTIQSWPRDGAGKAGTLSISLSDREQLTSYAMEVLTANGLRRHTIGVYISYPKLEIWYFDRSGAVGSTQVDLSADYAYLLFFIHFLASATPAALGFDPDIRSGNVLQVAPADLAARGRELYPSTTIGRHLNEGAEDEFKIEEWLPNSRALIGEGKHFWNGTFTRLTSGESPVRACRAECSTPFCSIADSKPEPARGPASMPISKTPSPLRACLKLCWEVASRISEAELILEAYRHCVVISINGDDSWMALPLVLSQQCLIHLDGSFRGNLNKAFLAGPPGGKPAAEHKRSDQLRKDYEDRVLRVLITSPLCSPLHSVTNPKDFLHACVSLLDAHHALYHKAQILHRAITPSSLLVQADNPSRGILANLNFAIKTDRLTKATSRFRPLSSVFVAQGLCDPPAAHHTYYHDLESFLWVIYWICSNYADGKRTEKNPFAALEQASWSSLREAKIGLLRRQSAVNLTQNFEPLTKCIASLKAVFYKGRHNSAILDGTESYTKIRGIMISHWQSL